MPPPSQGLYDSAYEHDACGVAFVARLDAVPSHETVQRALTALANLEHRGAEGADANTGDGAGITVQLPDVRHDKVTSGRFLAQMPANARLAGLLRKGREADGQPLVPFVFAEVRLPRAKTGLVPQLSSKLPSSRWVFNWDARRGVGYLLVEPRAKEEGALRFHVKWEATPRVEGSGAGQ